ncbi:MAG: efflux RND transporter periplasmic adaptor subunit [Gammaproteobacteria bacterium]
MRSRNTTVRLISLVAVLAAVFTVSGCGQSAGSGAKDAGEGAPAKVAAAKDPLLISPEDLLAVRSSALASGPSITGSVQPERRADLRAEVPAVVLAVLKENGDPVRRGDLLVRLDATAIRDTLVAATASERAAVQAFEQAERQFQRMATLRQTGVVSTQQLEDVEIRRNTTQSDREAAKTRVVSARQQLERTEVRAPFDGVVSDRKVSAGDTAQVGKELLKVIDPRSLRFEGMVSADSIGEVRAGQRVEFRVHGFADKAFPGTVTRVNPAANATTRQVEVLVSFDDAKQQPNVAGLYAEGRIEIRHTAALSLPATALVREGDRAFAWRVKDRTLHKVSVSIGERNARNGEFVLQSGLAEGDTLLRYPTSTLQDGQPVTVAGDTRPTAVLAEGRSNTVASGR